MARRSVSRREFVSGSIAGAIAAHTLSQNTKALAAQRQPLAVRELKTGERFRVGVIGCGVRGGHHIQRALTNIPQYEITALCDLLPEKIEEKKKLIRDGNPRGYTDFEKMLKEMEFDTVLVVIPNYLHKVATVAALESKCHVMCEKPMAMTVAECNAVLAAAEKSRKAIQIPTESPIGSKALQTLIETVHQKAMGKILYSTINSYRGDWAVASPDPQQDIRTNWRLKKEMCGGVAYEVGVHILHLNDFIMESEPVEVCALEGVHNRAIRPRTSADHSGIVVRFASGAVTNYGGVVYGYDESIPQYFFGTHGTAEYAGRRLTLRYGLQRGMEGYPAPRPKPQVLDLPEDPHDSLTNHWLHFMRVMQGKAVPLPDGYAGRRVIQILQGAEVSSREKRTVKCAALA
jgi:predicted dehydrogenase